MKAKSKYITLPCSCGCCMLVIEKQVWEDEGINYSITVQDARYDHNVNTLWGRLKRAGKALFGKPVYFNEVFIDSTKAFDELLDKMKELREWEEKPV